jgi:hypothetical protein
MLMGERNNIEDIFRDTFDGHSVTPSRDLWDKIDSRLPKVSFFKFYYNRFNVYYLAASVIAISFLVTQLVYFQQDRELQISINENIVNQEVKPILDSQTIVNEAVVNNSEISIMSDKDVEKTKDVVISDTKTINNLENSNRITEDKAIASKKSAKDINIKDVAIVEKVKTPKVSKKEVATQTIDNQIVVNDSQSADNQKNTLSSQNIIADKDIINTQSVTLETDKVRNNNNPETPAVGNPIAVDGLSGINDNSDSGKTLYNQTIINRSTLIAATINRKEDDLIIENIIITPKNKQSASHIPVQLPINIQLPDSFETRPFTPYPQPGSKWEVSAWYSPMYILKQDVVNQSGNSVVELYSKLFSSGVEIKRNFGKFSIDAGLSMLHLKKRTEDLEMYLTFNPIEVVENEALAIIPDYNYKGTVGEWENADSEDNINEPSFAADARNVSNLYYQLNEANASSSAFYYNNSYYYTDTVEYYLTKGNKDYYYIEIPVHAGYKLISGKLEAILNGGLTGSFFREVTFKNEEKDMSKAYNQVNAATNTQEKELQDFYLSASAGVRIGYKLTPFSAAFVEPHLRYYFVDNQSVNEPFGSNNKLYGIKMGLSYSF